MTVESLKRNNTLQTLGLDSSHKHACLSLPYYAIIHNRFIFGFIFCRLINIINLNKKSSSLVLEQYISLLCGVPCNSAKNCYALLCSCYNIYFLCILFKGNSTQWQKQYYLLLYLYCKNKYIPAAFIAQC